MDSLWWYTVLLALSIIFLPLTHKLFGKYFPDGGYAFSKTIGILIISYLMLILSQIKIIPISKVSILSLVVVMLGLNIYIGRNIKIEKKKIIFFIAEEIMFLISLLFWVYVRGQEPSIRGLEKFMDFGFINSILRSDFSPPLDMWYAGETINYYYFGHFTGAILTKLTSIASSHSYNLILSTIFASGITHVFSLSMGIFYWVYHKIRPTVMTALLSTFIVNLGGNLHTIYLFTSGYNTDKPVPFWEKLTGYNPAGYWYPNATRFIPFTIHEFPIYSYVVADLHGHVFDIAFVLLTLAILYTLFVGVLKKNLNNISIIIKVVSLGSLSAIHYMTNAFDGPIYILLTLLSLFMLFGLRKQFLFFAAILISTFIIISLPFTTSFKPFVSGIGINCAPHALINMGKLGPFIFEKGNCQISPLWMLVTLWGFFWFNFLFLIIYAFVNRKKTSFATLLRSDPSFLFAMTVMSFGSLLLAIPEIFYIKDIYPAHFRANTMFKMGYQAFIMMGVASAYVFLIYKRKFRKEKILASVYFLLFACLFILIAVYPKYAINSYYGKLDKKPQLDGTVWVKDQFPDYAQIIKYFNDKILGTPVILEAQGDSYTDFNIVSSYTGLPTVAGWWVHEWLWRGDSSVVGSRIPDIETVYKSDDVEKTLEVIDKYKIEYIIVGPNEIQKYQTIDEDKLNKIGRLIFTTSSGVGKVYHTTYSP